MRKPSYGRPRTIAPPKTLSRALPPLALPKLSPPRPPKSAPPSRQQVIAAKPQKPR